MKSNDHLKSLITNILMIAMIAVGIAIAAMLATGALGGPLDPPGAPASTDSVRLPGTPISGPTSIAQPGHYYVTRDITAAPGSTWAIMIDADDVSIDLGGFTLSGDDTIGSAGLFVQASRQRISISNGTVRDFAAGVWSSLAKMVRIDNVVAYSNTSVGFLLGEDAVLEQCAAAWNGSVGVSAVGSRVVVRECEIVANGVYGVQGVTEAPALLIERSSIKSNNTLQNPSGGGIGLFSAQRATIRDNDFGFNSYYDIYISGGNDNVIIRNVLDCISAIFDSGVNTYAIVNNSPYPTRTAPTAAPASRRLATVAG